MSRVTRFPIGRATAATGSALLPLLAATVAVSAAAVPAAAASAAPSASVVNLYVAPRPPGMTAAAAAAETGAVQHPFTSVAQAAQSAHQLSASSDVIVHLAAGKYRLTQPLTFTNADAGQNGHTDQLRRRGWPGDGHERLRAGDGLDAAEPVQQHLGGQCRHRGELPAAVRQRRGGAPGRDPGAPLRLQLHLRPG